MARTVAQIQAQIKTKWAQTTELAAANSTSATAIWNLITYVFAVSIAFFEQLIDSAKVEIETIAAAAVPGTPEWIQAQVFMFQYSAITPQVIELVNFVPTYPTIDETLRIVTKCSVVTNTNNTVLIKVSKTSGTLSGSEVTALTAYLDAIMFAGVRYSIVNLVADKLSIGATVYYNGQYSAVIAINVKRAISAYMADLPFNGTVKMSDIQAAIISTSGVNDVTFDFIYARANATSFAAAYKIYDLSLSLDNRVWNTVSGTIVEETTGGETFDDTITFQIS